MDDSGNAPDAPRAEGPGTSGPRRRGLVRGLVVRSKEVVVLAALTGALTGALVAGFDQLVVHVLFERVAELPTAVLAVAPVVGLAAAAVVLRTVGRGASPATADEYLRAFHAPDHGLGVRAGLARLAAAVCTLGSGGPMGLEGPSLYGGATIGSQLQRRLPKPFRHAEPRTLLVAGAAAGVAAIFKAPATGVVFALEVPFRDDLARRMLLPTLVAAATGYLTFVAFVGTAPLFPATGNPELSVADLVGAVVLGVLAGLGARSFAWLLRAAKRAVAQPVWLRLPAAGAMLVGLFAVGHLLTGDDLAYGPGYAVVDWATSGDAAVWVLVAMLLVRCGATAATVAGGGVGGLFIPLVVGGALVGRIVGDVVPSADPELFAVLGVAAFLGAGYRVPLAAVMFVAETTGRPGFVVPGLLAAVAAELVMGGSSVTAYQRATS